jgi:tripartite-type tricarboxylate transporter receptor subunit TctC
MRGLRRLALGTAVATLALTTAGVAGAQTAASFPSRPIRIVVPFPPGAFNDLLGRMLAQRFQETWGQPAVVDNRPGGGTVIGSDFVAKAPADGHTLLIVAFPFALLNSLHTKSGLDATRDFAPVVYAAGTPNILVTHNGFKANSVAEVIAMAKASPGKINYASTGVGTSNHLSMELFKAMTGTDIVHVAYKGSAPAVTDLIGGQVNVMFDNTPNVLQHIRAGKMKALGVTSAGRSSFTPELPPVSESVPGYEVMVWFGVVAPANTPRDVVQKLNAEVVRFMQTPEGKDRFQKAGVDAIGGSPEDFGRHIRAEVEKWSKVVRDAKVTSD